MAKKDNVRSVFITSSGDPYVLLYCLQHIGCWGSEVDEIWVCINSTMEQPVINKLLNQIPPKVKIVYINQRLGYGKPIDVLLNLSSEGSVLLLEDDTLIFKRKVVDKYFRLLESDEYDLIGSPRMSCTKKVADQLKEEFDLSYEGWGDKGPNFWPNFLWIKKEHLLKTDRNFGPTKWGDTFAWMSVQLRRMGLKIKEIPQYHTSPDDFENKENQRGIFDDKCGYIHIGSLSSGIESYLLDKNDVPLTDRAKGIKSNGKEAENNKEMQKRLAWWNTCYWSTMGRFDEFDKIYFDALNDFQKRAGIKNYKKWQDLYKI
jgi:hypothetical protein